MEALFPDWITTSTTLDLDAVINNPATQLKLTILIKNPEFASGDAALTPGVGGVAHITSMVTLTELLNNPAWQDVNQPAGKYQLSNWAAAADQVLDVSAVDATAPTNPPTVGVTRNVNVTTGAYNYWPEPVTGKPCVATGFVLSFSGGPQTGKIAMIFRLDEPMYLTGDNFNVATTIGYVGKGLFSYIEGNGINHTAGWSLSGGDLSIVVPTLDWETARCAHVWIDPQRINYVMNPSFRLPPSVGWRSNATTIEQKIGTDTVSAGIVRDGSSECAHLTKTTGPIILESNFFPTNTATETWRVSAAVSGAGRFRVGIVFFPPSMAESGAIYVHTPWETVSAGSSDQSDFPRIFQSIPTPDNTKEGCVRIEFDGTECWVDEVLAAPEDGPGTYFDASWDLGQPSDYTWYGAIEGIDNETIFSNQSFSLFYNNRKNLDNLLFGYITPPDPINGKPARYSGEVQNWVPEGVNVVTHWDDVFSNRVHTWMEDVIVPPKDFIIKNVVTNLP